MQFSIYSLVSNLIFAIVDESYLLNMNIDQFS